MTEQTLSALVRSLYSQARSMARVARSACRDGRPVDALWALTDADRLRHRARWARRWYVAPADRAVA